MDEQTGIMQESTLTVPQTLVPNKPHPESKFPRHIQMKKYHQNQQVEEIENQNIAVDKCKENMKKRRMLFQRDQAERKELEEISVNNTMIDGESGIQSHEVSFSKGHSRGVSNKLDINKRESSISNISEMSGSWFNDPDWHRQSQKLERIVKWQRKCETKLGFNPVEYFGGLAEEGENLQNLKKDHRFSEMFSDAKNELLKTSLEQKKQENVLNTADLLEKEDLTEEELFKIIKEHKQHLQKIKQEQQQVINQITDIQKGKGGDIHNQSESVEEFVSSSIIMDSQSSENEDDEEEEDYGQSDGQTDQNYINSISNPQSKRQTFSNDNGTLKSKCRSSKHDSSASLKNYLNPISQSSSDTKEHERILNIFNDGSGTKVSMGMPKEDFRFIAMQPPLTERIDSQQQQQDVYRGKINLFKLNKSNSQKGGNFETTQPISSLKASHQSRSNSREKTSTPQSQSMMIKKSNSTATLGQKLIQKVPLYKQRNALASGLTQILSNQSIKSDIYSKYVPSSERSLSSSISCASKANAISQNFSSSGKQNNSQNIMIQFQSGSTRKIKQNKNSGQQSSKNQSKLSLASIGTANVSFKNSQADEALEKINKFYQGKDQIQNSVSKQKIRSKTPLSNNTCIQSTQGQLQTSIANLRQAINSKNTNYAPSSTQSVLHLFQSQQQQQYSQVLSARNQIVPSVLSQKNSSNQNSMYFNNTSGSQTQRGTSQINHSQQNHHQPSQHQSLLLSTQNNAQIFSLGNNPFKIQSKSRPRGSQQNQQKDRKTAKSKEMTKIRQNITHQQDENQNTFNNACEVSFSNNKDQDIMNHEQNSKHHNHSQAQAFHDSSIQMDQIYNQQQYYKQLQQQQSMKLQQQQYYLGKKKNEMLKPQLNIQNIETQLFSQNRQCSNEEMQYMLGPLGYFNLQEGLNGGGYESIQMIQSPHFQTTERGESFPFNPRSLF